jgi:dihydrofolate synthase/folylpolyglutamate synthase
MKIPQTYQQALDFLFSQLPMFQREGKAAFKKDLTNTKALLAALGQPEKRFPAIHIGGTNGKGSLSSMLNSILMEAGFKTGLYTSPHLKSFTERVRINGQEIPEQEVVDFVQQTYHDILEIKPSFFEMSFAMAMDHFAKQAVDIAVVEVGLGGRLDSTNVLSPLLSAITNISLDHQMFLGDNRTAIAGEKAGIIKPHTPIVIGEMDAETAPVFQAKAKTENAPLFFAQQEKPLERINGDLFSQFFQHGKNQYNLGLAGTYQQENLQTCLVCVDQLRALGWEIPADALQRGLQKVRQNSGLRGRMEVLHQNPLVIADTGHNLAGVKAVLAQLAHVQGGPKHIVWGMVDDKDIGPIMALLPQSARYYFVKADVPRGKDAHELAEIAKTFGLQGQVYPSVKEGLEACLAIAQADELCLVGGSTFVVAEAI